MYRTVLYCIVLCSKVERIMKRVATTDKSAQNRSSSGFGKMRGLPTLGIPLGVYGSKRETWYAAHEKKYELLLGVDLLYLVR